MIAYRFGYRCRCGAIVGMDESDCMEALGKEARHVSFNGPAHVFAELMCPSCNQANRIRMEVEIAVKGFELVSEMDPGLDGPEVPPSKERKVYQSRVPETKDFAKWIYGLETGTEFSSEDFPGFYDMSPRARGSLSDKLNKLKKNGTISKTDRVRGRFPIWVKTDAHRPLPSGITGYHYVKSLVEGWVRSCAPGVRFTLADIPEYGKLFTSDKNRYKYQLEQYVKRGVLCKGDLNGVYVTYIKQEVTE